MSRPVIDRTNYEYEQDDLRQLQKNIAHARVATLVGLKRDRIGLADVLEDMYLTPVTSHGFLVFIDLLFWNGLQYKRRPDSCGRNGGTPWPEPWAEATFHCRGFGSVWSPKMSRRSRSKRETHEISMVDVMVVPVPMLPGHAAMPPCRTSWDNTQLGRNGSVTRLS